MARHGAPALGSIVQADKLRLEGRLGDAEKLVRDVLRKLPKSQSAWLVLAKVLSARGDLPAAEQAYAQVIENGAGAFEARVNLGVLLSQRGALQESLAQFRAALTEQPKHALALRNYGGVLRNTGALNEAIEVLERSLALAPDDAGAHTNLGLALSALGRHERALRHLERAVQLAPRELLYHHNLLLLMHYSSELTREAIFEAHLRFGRVAAELVTTLPALTPLSADGRKLRVGFVSADLRRHSVAFFLEPLIEAWDKQRFELYAYSGVRQADEVTLRLARSFDTFREVALLDDTQLAAQIRSDQIDVLIDLAGHTQGNRLAVFAQRPAPLQLSYLGYPDTTGLETIDYRVTDAWADPEGAHEAIHSERLLRLAPGFLCYRPPASSPDVVEPPSVQGAVPTFGSFNALAKISDATLRLWQRLLAEVPEARLLIKQMFLSHPDSRASFEQRLADHGIDRERVTLQGHIADLHGHLAAYSQVDVALDTFPYHGTTTSCDALWMGVPLVTLAGDTHVSRVGVSLLSRLQLEEFVAYDADAYVHKARDLLRDQERRRQLRATLRERMQRSGLTEGAPVARALEAALLRAFAELPARAAKEATPALLPCELASSAHDEVRAPAPELHARWFSLRSGISIAISRGHDELTSYVLDEQGEWFEDEAPLVPRLLRAGEAALDIGAAHGVMALAMARAVGPRGSVCALEPSLIVSERLRASARQNGFDQLRVLRQSVHGERVEPERSEPDAHTTLDQLVTDQGLSRVAFIRLAESSDQLLAGATSLLARDEVLWLVPRNDGVRERSAALENLSLNGHALYRVVPGLQLLFPHPVGTDSDPFLRNLFAARPARALELEQRGLLARFSEAPELPEDGSWQEALLGTRLGGRADLARGFSQPEPGKERHQRALSAYALAQRPRLSATQRAFCLRRGLELALSAIEQPHELSRLMTVARLAWAWGRRAIAVEALMTALSAVDSGRASIAEPFLPPCPRYDDIEPGARLSDWVVSALLEQMEKLRVFSGFFDNQPDEAATRLGLIARLGFQSPEMAQRLRLVVEARGSARDQRRVT